MPDTTTTGWMQVGDPTAHRGIAVAPIFPRVAPRAEYVPLDTALAGGLRVTEVDEGGSVGELTVSNPLHVPVLLCDGEELVGAKQNRVMNVTVLVEEGTTVAIPVSCVEQGRWRYESDAFAAAPHTAYPELRRRKAERLASAPMARGAAQGEVWDEVAGKAGRLGNRSATGAHADIQRQEAPRIDELCGAFPLEPGQCGAVLALAGEVVCLDAVSRPEAFAVLYPKLLRGYMLDAVERLDGDVAGAGVFEAFMGALGGGRVDRRPSVGLGLDMRVSGNGVIGSGLEVDGEVVQLSAYPSRGDAAEGLRVARMSRPSVRRRH